MKSSRLDNIVRAIKFVKIFYKLEPKYNVEVTIKQIEQVLGCSNENARRWRDDAGYVLPIAERGNDYERSDRRRGPPATLYGVLR